MKHYRALNIFCGIAIVCGAGFAPAFAQTTTYISPAVNDGSFETPATTSFIYSPTGTPWTFSSNAGVSVNSPSGSTFSVNGPVPDGSQYAFLQVASTVTASSIAQTINVATNSVLSLTYDLAGRSLGGGGVTVFSAALDGTVFDTEQTTTGESFVQFSDTLTNVSAGTHFITFTATQRGGSTADNSALLDDVVLTGTYSAPEPSAGWLLAAAVPVVAGCVRSRRLRSRS